MRVKEVSVSAVIPNAQYSNLQPTITVEVENGDVEGAKHEALRHVEAISKLYAEAGKALPQLHQGGADNGGTQAASVHRPLVELHSEVTNGTAFFDEEAHRYTNQFGQELLSGSKFAEGFSPEFNADFILPKMEAKYGVPASDIKDMWKAKADASCSIGDAIHKALELYGKYRATGLMLDKDKKPEEKKWSHVHDNPILNAAVASFYRGRLEEQALYEQFVVNNDALICGSIDRLLITGDKRCRVQDFKTNGDIQKKGSPKFLSAPFTEIENTTLNKYWLQLSFYAHILQLAGWAVEGLDIFHYTANDEGDLVWQTHTHDVIDIAGAEILQKIKQ